MDRLDNTIVIADEQKETDEEDECHKIIVHVMSSLSEYECDGKGRSRDFEEALFLFHKHYRQFI